MGLTNPDWIKSLKMGDKVILRHNTQYADYYTKQTIDYIFLNGNVLVQGVIFDKDSGKSLESEDAIFYIEDPFAMNHYYNSKYIEDTLLEVCRKSPDDISIYQARAIRKILEMKPFKLN